jgi:glycosyltransferase involved in cell wall biosynthesis
MHPNSGGTSQGIRNIVPELEKMGVYNEVVCLDAPNAAYLQKDPFKIIALGPASGPWQYSQKLVPWLIDNIGRFDVIIVNALWLYHGYAFIKAFKRYKKKAVHSDRPLPRFYVMPHGMLDPYFQRSPDRRIKAIRNWLYWKLIESNMINTADGLLFTCKKELELARESFRPYHPSKEMNIGYGVEAPPPFEARMKTAFHNKCSELKGEPFILFLSRIHEKKGIDQLIEAYANVMLETEQGKLSKGGGGYLSLPKLVIAGPGLDTPYGHKIQGMATSSESLRESIFFPGMLSGDAKWGAFYTTDAFILPSHQENFGIAVVEALACGSPVLISNQVNIWPEIFEAGGGLVEDDTIEGIKKLLISWMQMDDEKKEIMGMKALQSFKEYFSIYQAAKNICEQVSF